METAGHIQRHLPGQVGRLHRWKEHSFTPRSSQRIVGKYDPALCLISGFEFEFSWAASHCVGSRLRQLSTYEGFSVRTANKGSSRRNKEPRSTELRGGSRQ